ncbi:unnamed protein product, partial [Brenthis ino]
MIVRKDAVEAGAFTKFRLLMWKNFLQQWRHRKQTFVELLLPVLTMTLVLILRHQIEPNKEGPLSYPPIPAYSLNHSAVVFAGLDIKELSLAYSPQSPILDDIVRSAVVNLLALNLRDLISIITEQENISPPFPIEIPPDLNTTLIYEIAKRLVRITPYNSSSQLRGIYRDEQEIRRVIAAIQFDDSLLGTTQLPNNLTYAIRFPERPRLNSFFGYGGRSWRTQNSFPLFELPGPRFPYSWEGGNDPGYVNELFIALQHTISMELISRVAGERLQDAFPVNIQRYPHPSYMQDLAVQTLIFIFPMFFMISFSYTAVNIVRNVTVEKELQLKETMKIMGLPTWLHWTAWYFKQMIYMIIITGFILIILKVNWFTTEDGFRGYAVFTNTPWTVLLFYITLYLSCTIFFCFMISGLFSKASTAALFGGVIWFMSFVPAVLLGIDVEISLVVQAFTCLSINTAMSFGFQLILSKENNEGMQWGEFFTTHSVDTNRLLFGHVCIFLIVDSVLYMLIALYLEQVMPGPFGAPKPWYFPFQKSFWCSPKKVIYDDLFTGTTDMDGEMIKEKDPRNLDIGVKMMNLTKVYGNNVVVNNLNLNIFDDQITVLLGHNGAGKSTTISMLTGNVEISQGSVWVAGYNMATQTSLGRARLGLCPQHNVIFDDLTVREHFEFFTRLKGYSGKDLYYEIDDLIDRLEMQEKRNYLARGLSGGQKRRLCVGIALSGGPRVVLLDEPTSGMDPSSRRALWDLLQKEKKGRSIILTTHFMDEADYLGDRVAIMANGRLQCVGSPYFLKQHYGVGYTLVIVKTENFQTEYCTALIGKYIPGTVVKEDHDEAQTSSVRQPDSERNQQLKMAPPGTFSFVPAEWPKYITRFKRYMSVSGNEELSDKSKIDFLLYSMGDKAEDIIIQFDKNLTYTELLQSFDKFFFPKKNVIYERFKFNSRVQKEGEDFDQFVTDLHKLAEGCEYNLLKEELIRDRVVIGIRDRNISDRMLLKNDLKLEEAIQMGKQAEIQKKESMIIRENKEESEINRVKVGTTTAQRNNEELQLKGNCWFCGQKRHPRCKCPASNITCFKCRKTGHFARLCRAKIVKNIEKEEIGTTYEVSFCESKQKYLIDVDVFQEDQFISKVKFLIDTGADISAIPDNIIKGCGLSIVKSDDVIKGPDGTKLVVLGTTNLKLRYKENVYEGKEVTYNLPNNYSHAFEDLLNDLERNKQKIEFISYGLVATTMEDVFMSVGSDVELSSESEDTTITAESQDRDASVDNLSLENLDKSDESETGLRLLWLHASGVWMKLFLVWTRSWGRLILQVLVPILQITLSLGILEYLTATSSPATRRPLTLTERYLSTETLLSFNGTNSSSLGSLAKESYEMIFNSANIDSMKLTLVEGQSIEDYYLERTSDPVVLGVIRNKLLTGATFDEGSATAWFSNFGYHDVANSLAAVHAALLKAVDPSVIFKVYNHPLEANYNDDNDLQVMVSLVSMQVAGSIGNSLAIVSAVFIVFYIKERVTRAKLLQRAAGAQPAVLWGAAAVYDWLWFCVLAATIIACCAAFRIIGLSTVTELGRLYLCIIVYGAAMLPLHYLFSLVFNGPALGFVVMFFVNTLLGLMGAQIVEALSLPNMNTGEAARIMDNILPFFPLYSLVTSTRKMNQVGLRVHSCLQYCDYVVSLHPEVEECTMEALCEHFSKNCCIRENPYFDWEDPGVLRYLICTLASCVIFWIILMIIEYNWLQRVFARSRKTVEQDESTMDPDVLDEAKHAKHVDQNSREVALVARGLTKYYKNHLAVDQISFTVGEAECFGLLGVNGAGKTTTFKMLMGDETISSGDAFVSGLSVKKDLTKVHQNIGYCPQFDAVFDELTGRETLYLFSRFRGLKYSHSSVRAHILADALGFTKHLDKKVCQYSGGNKRKLSTAVAMLGRTRLMFVDEPTTGVDPAAKRQVWRAVRAARRAGRALVLTSHSMEECEALCSRLTVMVNGRFQCIGTPQHLKNKYSQGFTLTIKIKTGENADRSSITSESKAEAVKNYVATHYNNAKIVEEYQGIITYYLPDRSMPWSKMFGIIEKAKRELDVEDYSILQTTLEQIFLQFTKYQKEGR